jgi:hypothetical protein
LRIGTLDVEVKRNGKHPQLVIQGGLPLALASDVTAEELGRLARYVEAEAVKLRDEKKER